MPNPIIADLNSRLVALKIARRSMRRNIAQTLLIILVIALPIIPGAIALTVLDSKQLTAKEQVEYQLGHTQARVQAQVPVSDQEVASTVGNVYQLPSEGTAFRWAPNETPPTPPSAKYWDPTQLKLVNGKWLSERLDVVQVATASGIGNFALVEAEAWNPALSGVYKITSGKAPTGPDQVMVSAAALHRLNAKIGDALRLTAKGETRTIVGTIQDSHRGDAISAIYAFPSSISGVKPSDDLINTAFYLVSSSPMDWSTVIRYNHFGIGVLSQEVLLNPPPASAVPVIQAGFKESSVSPVVGQLATVVEFLPIAFVPIAILAGSAFAFGARRQARTLAVLSSLGSQRKYLRFITVANGIWLGLFGGVIGVALGLASSTLVLPAISDGSRMSYPGFHVPWLALFAVVVVATLIGTLVSLIPAITASKLDVLSTLRGTRSAAKVKRRIGFGGIVIASIGVATILIGSSLLAAYTKNANDMGEISPMTRQLLQMLPMVGAVILLIGLLMTTGWLLTLIRLISRRFGASTNYASNDLLYSRKRYQPVIASVIATSFVAAIALGGLYSIQKSEEDTYTYRLPSNQIETDPMGWSLTGGATPGQPLSYYENLLEKSRAELSSFIRIASAVAPIKNAAVVAKHLPLSTLGYKVDPSTGLAQLGAEGDQPLIRINPEYLCPWDNKSPLHDKFEKMPLSEQNKLAGSAKYKFCYRYSSMRETIFVGDEADLNAALGHEAPASAAAALKAGHAVAFGKGYETGGQLTLDWYPSGSQLIFDAINNDPSNKTLIDSLPKPVLAKTDVVEAVSVDAVNPDLTVMISRSEAGRLGISTNSGVMFVNYLSPLTVAQTDQLNADLDGKYSIDTGYPNNPELTAWLTLLIAGFFVIAATGIALGLAQIESRTDLATLGSIGAPRRFRARVLGFQALALTASGTILGSAAGLCLIFPLMTVTYENMFRLALPQLLLLIFGIPVLAAAVFWLGTPNRTAYKARLSID
jgi:putative ABC transport system permease protein